MDKNMPYTNNFLKGLTSLTGIPIKKIQEYAKENNPFNILEHPNIIEPNEKQLQKIGLLNEFIASYNLLKVHESENKIKFSSPKEAADYFIPLLSGIKDKEKFMVAFLDNGNNIIQTKIMSEGNIAQAVIYPRDLLKEALACDCKAMILAHNHPGGSNSPSNEDKALTQKLVNIFHPLDIKIHDHIIVAGVNFCSMAEKGYMPQVIDELANYEPIKIENKNILEENQSFNSEIGEELEL
ncbi:DNA repair protein RadC [Clostridium algifaecis]|uniref:DNA repair protein RadC n=1 Tax=Clostridium algifaecis TaxID=1472040 RepID=A0ABS4KTQ6_9CLOT|nr:JAB domain-containing protein [Clostridium algifaecis]MBP2033412.1 DNA repair protein RadC [Clostridium algifaecis]